MDIHPISRGVPDGGLTLYVPYRSLRHAQPVDRVLLRDEIARHLIDPLDISIDDDGVHQTIRLSGLSSHTAALQWFERIKSLLMLIVVEAEYVLVFGTRLQDLNWVNISFPDGWAPANEVGWTASNGLISIDGAIDPISPALVDESKRVVRIPVAFGYIDRKVKSSILEQCVAMSLAGSESAPPESSKLELAYLAYADAFSHDNMKVRFLSLFTCLEVLATRHAKGTEYDSVIQHMDEALETFRRQSNAEMQKRVAAQMAQFLAQFKQQSTGDAVRDLAKANAKSICEGLDPGHPGRTDVEAAISRCYSLRSKLTHANDARALEGTSFQEAYAFLLITAKVMLRDQLIARNSDLCDQPALTVP